MRLQLAMLFIACFAACSKNGDALVVVTVESPITLSNVASLHAAVMANGHSGSFSIPLKTPITIPPAQTFGVAVPAAYVGAFTIDVDAIDTNGKTLLSGSITGSTSHGKRTDVTVVLGQGVIEDGGVVLDLSMSGDGATPVDGGQDATCFTSCAAAGLVCGTFVDCNGGTEDCGACTVTSVEPQVAAAGQTIALEGKFPASMMVKFPGGTLVAPTTSGSGHATVVVPATAGAGVMSLSGATSSANINAYFRRASFSLGAGPFAQGYEQVDAARPTPTLFVDRSQHATIALPGTLVVFGGQANSPASSPPPALTSMEFLPINADGTLGPASTQDFDAPARTLVNGRALLTAVATSNTVYAIGGLDASIPTVYSSVEAAQMNGDGSGIQTFAIVPGVTLNTARWGAASAIIGDYFYVFGGGTVANTQAAGAVDSIERSPISANGALGPFEKVTTKLVMPTIGASALVIGNWVYLFGAYDGVAIFSGAIQRAPINADGSLGAFVAAGAMQIDRILGGVMQLGQSVYAIGGLSTNNGAATGPKNSASIESAPINADGSLGTFTASVNVLTVARAGYGSPVIVGNYLHIVGGSSAGGGPSGSVPAERCSIDSSQKFGSFSDTGIAATQARRNVASVVIGNNLYIFGGETAGPLNNIDRIPILDANGTLGTPVSVGGGTIPTMAGGALVVFGNTIYYFGGSGAGTGLLFNIAGDGSLSLGSSSVTPPTTPRENFHLAVIGNTLYAIGGWNPSTDEVGVDTVEQQKLTISNHGFYNGLGGSWSASTAMMTNPHVGGVGALVGNGYHLIGGTGTDGTNMDTAPVVAGVLTSFASESCTGPLSTGRYFAMAAAGSGGIAIVGGQPSALDMSVQFADSALLQQNSIFTGTSGNCVGVQLTGAKSFGSLTLPRQLGGATMVGNWLYVFAGEGGNPNTDQSIIEAALLQ